MPHLPEPPKILVLSKTSAYRHSSIPAAIQSFETLARDTGLFTPVFTEDANSFITPEALRDFSSVCFLQCTGDFLSPAQVDALRGYVRSGGGFVGIHGAAAGLLNHEWYGRLVGAHFESHPEPQPGNVLIEQSSLSSGAARFMLGDGPVSREGWMDEWYNFTTHPRQNAKLNILLRGDSSSFEGGKMGDDHPLAWYQDFEGGRSFYTALGHFDEAYRDEWFMTQILRAVMWTARLEEAVQGVAD